MAAGAYSQEFATGDKRGCGGRKSPQRGTGAEPRWGCGSEAPRSWRQMLISSYDGGHAPMSPLGYTTVWRAVTFVERVN